MSARARVKACVTQGHHVFFPADGSFIGPNDLCDCGAMRWCETADYQDHKKVRAAKLIQDEEDLERVAEAVQLIANIRSELGHAGFLMLTSEERDFLRNVEDRDIPRKQVSRRQIFWLRDLATDPYHENARERTREDYEDEPPGER